MALAGRLLSVFLAASIAAGLAGVAAGAQNAPADKQAAPQSAQPDPDIQWLAKTSKLYYSSAKAGLTGFNCAVHPDWHTLIVSATKGAVVAEDDPRIALLNSVKITLHARMRGGTTIEWVLDTAANGQQPHPAKSTTTTQQQRPAATRKYRAVTREDGLSCSFSQDLSISMSSTATGSASASANHFTCTDKAGKDVEIALISRDPNVNVVAKDGQIAIRSKQFGTIFRGNEEGTFDTYEMTDVQIGQLKAFLGLPKTVAPVPQPTSPGKPLDQDSTDLLENMHRSVQQTLEGFMQFWGPFFENTVVPDSTEGLDITHTPTVHTIHAKQGDTELTEVFSSDLLLEQFNVVMSGATIKFVPAYKPSPQGLLVNGFEAHILPGSGASAPPQNMKVGIEYQPVGALTVPAKLNMDVIGTGTFNFTFDGCSTNPK